MIVAKIDDIEITAEQFVKILKMNDSLEKLLEEVLTDKVTALEAKKSGLSLSSDEVQKRFDEIRRIEGLHRAKEAYEFIENLGVTVEEFEAYLTEMLYKEKMIEYLERKEAVEEYFKLHSPDFESIEISHVVVDSEGKAREILAQLADFPETFAEIAQDHSLDAETKEKGGKIGSVFRGSLDKEIEAKVFNASVGDLVGPFEFGDGLFFEIFKVDAKHPAELNDSTINDVKKILYDEWLGARAQEHNIEIL